MFTPTAKRDEQGRLILKVNASSLRYSHCLLSWYRTIAEGWVQPKFSSKIVYGLGVHKFCHTRYMTGDMKLAIDAGIKEFSQPKILGDDPEWLNSIPHFHWTIFDFWTNYLAIDSEFKVLLKPDGTPASEVTFELPFYEDKNIVVYISGTIDTIGQIKGGCYCIRDYKTTSFWDKKKYLSFYRVSHQLRFYILALKVMARLEPDSQLGFIGQQDVRAFIDGIFLKEKTSELAFERSEVFPFKQDVMDDFERSLVRRLKQLSEAIECGAVHLHEGIVKNTCELKYNYCSFFGACATGNPNIERMMIERDFIQRPYEPIHRDIANV